ncbi:hypothetical protein CHLRE_09g417025v5 [Chlamydomonas reinhardtii]|uniref:Uncharacterized protein n=1 Tax=Chlamydomonas reinhardtii TaxID=3055 RepID=A0A2K3DG35_CHLRE|nr:uncharacterized protein CHLRE_09g417025v5 [Chlamydomonas reinhardtii]PNW79485.1 hypothetical protein CHLRE_09g417025v5 [Chlamydomonas reinhardtii]
MSKRANTEGGTVWVSLAQVLQGRDVNSATNMWHALMECCLVERGLRPCALVERGLRPCALVERGLRPCAAVVAAAVVVEGLAPPAAAAAAPAAAAAAAAAPAVAQGLATAALGPAVAACMSIHSGGGEQGHVEEESAGVAQRSGAGAQVEAGRCLVRVFAGEDSTAQYMVGCTQQ